MLFRALLLSQRGFNNNKNKKKKQEKVCTGGCILCIVHSLTQFCEHSFVYVCTLHMCYIRTLFTVGKQDVTSSKRVYEVNFKNIARACVQINQVPHSETEKNNVLHVDVQRYKKDNF